MKRVEQGEPEITKIDPGYAWGYGDGQLISEIADLARHPEKSEICKCEVCGTEFSPKYKNSHGHTKSETFSLCSRKCSLAKGLIKRWGGKKKLSPRHN